MFGGLVCVGFGIVWACRLYLPSVCGGFGFVFGWLAVCFCLSLVVSVCGLICFNSVVYVISPV